MEDVAITATFGPAPGDWTTLSKTNRSTIEALYRHPLAHNLEWSAVVALFEKIGTVDHKPQDELAFGIAGEHHRIRKPHGKDLATTDVMGFRHMLSRAGWAPQTAKHPASPATPDETTASSDLLVVMDHHEARLFHLDIRSANPLEHVIRPSGAPLTRRQKDQAGEHVEHTPDDLAFYESVAQAMAAAPAIVLVGHGKGRSNAAHQLEDYLRQRHPDTALRLVCDIVADLPSLTAPQLLALGRRALTSGGAAPSIERPSS